MKIRISDELPGAGPGRSAYLHNRIERVFGSARVPLESVEMELRAEPKAERHVVTMTLTTSRGQRTEIVTTRRLLPDALAQAFDAAALHAPAVDSPGEADEVEIASDADSESDGDTFVPPASRPDARVPAGRGGFAD